MPYTPPAAQSPAASGPTTPVLSHSQSYNKSTFQENEHSRLDRPQPSSSRSYLSKHRRSPSVTKPTSFTAGSLTLDGTHPDKNLNGDVKGRELKQDPVPPKRPDNPTEVPYSGSPQTSSDEEATSRGRSRQVTNLAELQAAIRIIEQHRAGSPDWQAVEETKKARGTLGLPAPRLDISKTVECSQSEHLSKRPLSSGARKISHSRSSTESSAFFDFPRHRIDSPEESISPEDEDIEDDELRVKPALIRKKSGELVRPALRASSTKRRPLSMPGTPTYSKAVHFQDSSLEHVRHFLQVDRPIAVSAGSSPVETYDDDDEFPFSEGGSGSHSPPFDWEIRLTNFPRDTVDRRALPVRVESICLSQDTKVLIGSVAVQNLAFHKLVAARFTLDYWKTTSEVVAEFNKDVRMRQINDGCDRFTFSIKLEDQVNLENKTMYFCVRYHVNGQDYWDSNDSMNYQVDFTKSFKPQNGKQGIKPKTSQPLNASSRSRPSATFSSRPRSMPSFDDFAGMVAPYDFASFPQPSSMIGESPIRFKNRPNQEIVPDAPGRPKNSTNQQAFGNRYDFGASLSAAIQAASNSGGSSPPTREEVRSSLSRSENKTPPTVQVQSAPDAGKAVEGSQISQPNLPDGPKPTALTTEKPSLSSFSYRELLDKYCFVRSKPAMDNTEIIR